MNSCCWSSRSPLARHGSWQDMEAPTALGLCYSSSVLCFSTTTIFPSRRPLILHKLTIVLGPIADQISRGLLPIVQRSRPPLLCPFHTQRSLAPSSQISRSIIPRGTIDPDPELLAFLTALQYSFDEQCIIEAADNTPAPPFQSREIPLERTIRRYFDLPPPAIVRRRTPCRDRKE